MPKKIKIKSSGLVYIGGKYHMASKIIPRLKYNVKCYVELFGGAGHILFNKPKHEVEIYNDLDDNLYNFFKVLKERKNELIQELDSLIVSRKLFYEFRDSTPRNELEKAIRFFYISRLIYGGARKGMFAVGYKGNIAKNYYNSIKNLQELSNRIKNVAILNFDFRDLIKNIGARNSIMLYADPPYYRVENYYPASEGWTHKDHEELAVLLNNLKCYVAVSYYYFEGIEELYPRDKWQYSVFEKTKHSSCNHKYYKEVKVKYTKPKSQELLITNYDADEAVREFEERFLNNNSNGNKYEINNIFENQKYV